MNMPRIVVGGGGTLSHEDVTALAKAGVGELYVGYVPPSWHNKFGFATSPNRRYWQGASFTDPGTLKAALDLAHCHGCKVSLALNEHSYSEKTQRLALAIVGETLEIGIDAVIVADPDLLLAIRDRFPDVVIHVSGEMGLYNREAVRQLAIWGANRVILPRHLSLGEIKSLCNTARECSLDVEAFIMSERCCFEGAYCFPSHGYLTRHLCNDLGRAAMAPGCSNLADPQSSLALEEHLAAYNQWRSHTTSSPKWLGGECGLCACRDLKRAGVGFFKIVGRGVAAGTLLKRIRVLRVAVRHDGPDFHQVCRDLIESPSTCDLGYKCYYRE